MIINVKHHEPYPWQAYCYDHLTRYNVIVAPRQHGKTELMAELINAVALAPNIHQPIINLCADKGTSIYKIYNQRLNELFSGFKGWKYPDSKTPEAKIWRADGTYAVINFLGADTKPTGPTGTAAHLNIIDEAALVNYDFIMKSALPATDKTGGINVITGTVANNHYYDIYKLGTKKMNEGSPNWFTFYMQFKDKWSRQVHDTPEKIMAIEDKYDLDNPRDKLIYDLEYMCLWEAGQSEGFPLRQAMLKAKSTHRVRPSRIDPRFPLHMIWDDGRGTTAIGFFQLKGNFVMFEHYQEWRDSNLPMICKDVVHWMNKNGFKPGIQVLPHTMKERSYTRADGISRAFQVANLFKLNRHQLIINERPQSIETKLIAANNVFPYCHFSTNDSVAKFIEVLENYEREPLKKKGETDIQLYSDKIKKNSPYSHGGDAFCELGQAYMTGELFEKAIAMSLPKYAPRSIKHSVLKPF